MKLHPIDIGIITFYLIAVVLIGIYIRRRAGEGLDSYFLGGRKIPWYVLGVSNASSMFDITGTMWFVSVLFIYGLKGAWLPWLWPTFNQIFLMIFLAIWVRRSNVMTGAEWISTRFGSGRGGRIVADQCRGLRHCQRGRFFDVRLPGDRTFRRGFSAVGYVTFHVRHHSDDDYYHLRYPRRRRLPWSRTWTYMPPADQR